jgi:hypothetical protein
MAYRPEAAITFLMSTPGAAGCTNQDQGSLIAEKISRTSRAP